MKKSILALLMINLLLAACNGKVPLVPQKRADAFPQGMGQNLLAISEYDNKAFQLTTHESLGKHTSTKAELVISDSQSLITQFDFVKVTSESDLVGEIPFIGKVNHKYEMKMELDESYLKIFKIGLPNEIPISEHSIATKLSDGRLKIPVLGYAVRGYYAVEHALDDDNKKTHRLLEMPKNSKSEATHFKIDKNAVELFRAQAKTELFPADLFQGDWYFSETITGISDKKEESFILGFGLTSDGEFKDSTKVRLSKNHDSIRAINLNVDGRIDINQEINQSVAFEIPARWVSYKISKNGTGLGLSEEEDSTISWEKREYVLLDLSATSSQLNQSRHSKLIDIEISKNFISYTLHNTEKNYRIKYSFLKAGQRNYKSQLALKEDQRKFGYFSKTREFARTSDQYRQSDLQKNTFIQRFNPNKDIVFHFSKTTPQWLRDSAVKVIEGWNSAFEAAGAKSKVIIDTTKDVNLGDTRYNIINLIETLNAGDLFGIAGTIVDPQTGEVISGTANVHITPIKESVVSKVREYILSKINALDDKYVFSKDSGYPSQKISALSPKLKGIASSVADALSGTDKLQADLKKSLLNKVNFKSSNYPQLNDSFFFADNYFAADLFQQIEKTCPKVNAFISKINADREAGRASEMNTAEEQSAIESCVTLLTQEKMMGTLAHELGHTFGLRHNFYASNDSANFSKSTIDGSVIKSSSVMEYPSFEEDRLVNPGPYDVAAIRFGYTNSIEIDGENSPRIMKLSENLQIDSQLKAKGVKARSFKFCTDEDVDQVNIDPMCARHDHGTTPLEVVKGIINNYNSTVALHFNRFDRAISPAGAQYFTGENISQRIFYSTFVPLKMFYDKWRSHLSQYAGHGNEYLEKLSPSEYQALLKRMSEDARYKEVFNQYYPASRTVYGFLKQLVFLPIKQCVTENDKQQARVIPLEIIRKEIFANTGKSVHSCSNDEVLKMLAAKNLKLVAETGYFSDDFKFDISPEALFEANDIIGMKYSRLFAMITLVERIPSLNALNLSQGFSPNFSDEPDLRADLERSVVTRIVGGADLADLKLVQAEPGKHLLPVFQAEKELLIAYGNLFKRSLAIPGKIAETQQRIEKYSAFLSREDIPDSDQVAKMRLGGSLIVATTGQPIAKMMIDKLNQLQSIKNSKLVSSSVFQPLIAFSMMTRVPEKNLSKQSVADFVKMMLALTEEFQSIAKKPGIVQSDLVALGTLISTEQSLLEQIIKQAQIDSEAALEIFLNSDAAKVKVAEFLKLNAQQIELADLSAKGIKKRSEAIIKKSEALAVVKADLGGEIDAQIDILTALITGDL
jgi:hypothetical protein